MAQGLAKGYGHLQIKDDEYSHHASHHLSTVRSSNLDLGLHLALCLTPVSLVERRR